VGIFERPLRLEYIDGEDWLVYEAFSYSWDSGKDIVTITVPAGFKTDFASIPRFFWRVLPPTGKYGKAAVIHDAIYRTPSAAFTRAEADTIFRDAMKDLGVSWLTRTTMFRAVRLFGGRAYKAR
jgi:hypothetical protein